MLSTTVRAARPSSRHVCRLSISSQIQSQRHRPFVNAASSLAGAFERPQVRQRLLEPSCSLPGRALPITFRSLMSTKPPIQPVGIDKELEKKVGERKLESRPDEVTSTSSVRQVIEGSQGPAVPVDPLLNLKDDLNTVKETFALGSVPREAFGLGLAGTLPYLATSISTVYLSWSLNTEWPTTSSFINSIVANHDSATHWLQLLEPIQVGYGAVIISFLGAIHWGLEFAEKRALPDRTRFRYGIGVLAPAVAWPTIFMPIEWALTTQFAAFVALYFTDSTATVKGWAPGWYGIYRFVLTAIVGAAILISLVGRAKIGAGHARLSKAELRDRLHPQTGSKDRDWAKEEEKEKEKIQREKKEEEKKRKEAEEKAKKEEQKKEKAQKKADKPKSEGKGGQEKEESGNDDKQKADSD